MRIPVRVPVSGRRPCRHPLTAQGARFSAQWEQLALPARKGGPWAGGGTCCEAHFMPQRPQAPCSPAQLSPGFAQLLPSPALFLPFYRKSSLSVSHASGSIPSQAQHQAAWPKAALLYAVGVCHSMPTCVPTHREPGRSGGRGQAGGRALIFFFLN